MRTHRTFICRSCRSSRTSSCAATSKARTVQQAPLLDLTANTGYKYVGLCINMVVGMVLGRWVYRIAMLWTGSMTSYFMVCHRRPAFTRLPCSYVDYTHQPPLPLRSSRRSRTTTRSPRMASRRRRACPCSTALRFSNSFRYGGSVTVAI
mmetsp:Transcript_37147/g.64130  ORF Transcript_37147/g.64130 Transcript_37147/m.64130 type:complete len:150 (-) Transcript_37147:103-552(-)